MRQRSDEEGSRRVLDPIERISEVLFGLIMVLTFTGSLGIATAGRQEVRTMLIKALGCNLAWGIIDAVLYLMGCLADKGRDSIRFGIVTQRTRAYQTDRDVQRGLLVGLTYEKLDVAAYVFNPDESDPTLVVAATFGF